MKMVQLAPLSSIVAGAAGLAVIGWFGSLSATGWCAGLVYLAVSNALLARGLRRRGTAVFGPANAVTATRSTLVGLITALIATSFTSPVNVPLLIVLTVPTLALDAVDGWLARRTRTMSDLGARFDMEVDAFLIFALSVYVAPDLGWWTLSLGLMRYVYVAAGWMLPWLRRPVPPRYWRKVVAAWAGIALTLAASGLTAQWVAVMAVLSALGLLIESFGRDVVWQFARRRDPLEVVARSTSTDAERTPAETGQQPE